MMFVLKVILVLGMFRYNISLECKDGKHGKFCDKNCPKQCTKCHNETFCTVCSNKDNYGFTCENKCADLRYCQNGTCNPPVSCSRGYYGPTCRCKCHDKCKYNSCDSRDGYCDFGCVKGYMPDGPGCAKIYTALPTILGSIGAVYLVIVSVAVVVVICVRRRVLAKRRSDNTDYCSNRYEHVHVNQLHAIKGDGSHETTPTSDQYGNVADDRAYYNIL